MAYPMSPPDPTDVVGRRIVAFLIDFGIVVAVFLATMAGAFMTWSVTADSGEVSCSQASSTSFDSIDQPSAEEPSICIDLNDGEVRYVPEDDETAFSLLIYGSALAVGIVNSVLIQGLKGGSAGKLALGLRVIRADGRRANVGWNFLRWFLLIIGTICCIGWIVDLVMVFTTKGHRRVGDFAAGTFVVGKDDEGRPPQIVGVTITAPPAYAQTGAYGAPPGPYGGQPGNYPPPGGQPAWTPPPTLPAGESAPGPQSTPVESSTPGADGPTWDEAREAYIQYDPELAEWVQWDDAQGRWGPIDR